LGGGASRWVRDEEDGNAGQWLAMPDGGLAEGCV